MGHPIGASEGPAADLPAAALGRGGAHVDRAGRVRGGVGASPGRRVVQVLDVNHYETRPVGRAVAFVVARTQVGHDPSSRRPQHGSVRA